ncbi:sugar ABC transporter ATP-binding protein [Babesia caballi]|uniref:Sugar ABC transporter ATP-binding protein n=1 Tax=Babesia caballi TaxID=5871 RepID=A0AAV4LQW3_BABCB|nr:sugar ABC transporter ATP-binding protein [Babesia caballi]
MTPAPSCQIANPSFTPAPPSAYPATLARTPTRSPAPPAPKPPAQSKLYRPQSSRLAHVVVRAQNRNHLAKKHSALRVVEKLVKETTTRVRLVTYQTTRDDSHRLLTDTQRTLPAEGLGPLSPHRRVHDADVSVVPVAKILAGDGDARPPAPVTSIRRPALKVQSDTVRSGVLRQEQIVGDPHRLHRAFGLCRHGGLQGSVNQADAVFRLQVHRHQRDALERERIRVLQRRVNHALRHNNGPPLERTQAFRDVAGVGLRQIDVAVLVDLDGGG